MLAWIITGASNTVANVFRFRIVEICSDLGVVGPVVGSGVKIDPHRTTCDNFGNQQVRNPAGERAALGTRE